MSRLLKGLFSRKGQDKENATVAQDKKPQSASSSGRDVGAKVVDESFSTSASFQPDSSRASDGFSPKWELGAKLKAGAVWSTSQAQAGTTTLGQSISHFMYPSERLKNLWRRSIVPVHVLASSVNLAAVFGSMALTLMDIISVQMFWNEPFAQHRWYVSLFQLIVWTMPFIISSSTLLTHLSEGRLFLLRPRYPGFVVRESATTGKYIHLVLFYDGTVGPCLYTWVISVAGFGGTHLLSLGSLLAFLVAGVIFVRRCHRYFKDKPGSKKDFDTGYYIVLDNIQFLIIPNTVLFVFETSLALFTNNTKNLSGMAQLGMMPFLLMTHQGFVARIFAHKGYSLEKCGKVTLWFHRCVCLYILLTIVFSVGRDPVSLPRGIIEVFCAVIWPILMLLSRGFIHLESEKKEPGKFSIL